MRKALIVGINHYTHVSGLFGCVRDAQSVQAVLESNGDESRNFDCVLLTASTAKDAIGRKTLKDRVQALFSSPADVALFYFAGHGHVEATGGYIMGSDAEEGDGGLPLADLFVYANNSPANNKVIILDSCHSGVAGDPSAQTSLASIAEGVTVLTGSTKDQYATEMNGRGVFTELLVDALQGGAADLVGHITPGSVYAHVDQSLGAWDQRPVFKTNVTQFVSLRDVRPRIALGDLRKITALFPDPAGVYPLDPTYEPELRGREPSAPLPVAKHTEIFATLQLYNRLNLLVPVDAPHMWHAAMESKSCRLTVLGRHYHRLVSKGRI